MKDVNWRHEMIGHTGTRASDLILNRLQCKAIHVWQARKPGLIKLGQIDRKMFKYSRCLFLHTKLVTICKFLEFI